MNKYVHNIISALLSDVKEFKKYENLDKMKVILNNEVEGVTCKAVVVNNSPIADAFYGIIVFPDIKLGAKDSKINVSSYVIEIQQQAIDLLAPEELAALIIHDLSHNVLTTMVTERLKTAIYKACAMTSTKVVEVVHNINSKMYRLAVLDIANRTYKEPVVPGTDMYEADRVLVDMDIFKFYNAAINKISKIEYVDLSNPDTQNIYDLYTAEKLIKMVQEKFKGIETTYNQLADYVKGLYDTKVLSYYPSLETTVTNDVFGQDESGPERMKPRELQFIHEAAVMDICKDKTSIAAMILEASFEDNKGRLKYSLVQKEYDIINFKIDAVSSNYERLAILDNIYDNIFSLEKYLARHPEDPTAKQFIVKFEKLTQVLKSASIERKDLQIRVQYPAGFEG